MNIAEMTLEELQDYALQLQEKNASLEEDKKVLTGSVEELTGLNKQLQKRNNDLFMRVSQGVPDEGVKEVEKVETCEEFARKLIIKE